jgi:16S rRNA (adenine1518-N6/adenine1519-N6)-dimethyltransferase
MKAAVENTPKLRLRKRLGQHLLNDGQILGRIVEAAGINENDLVLEVGAGSGILTRELASRAARVISVELDERFLPSLEALAAEHPSLSVIRGDILRLDLMELLGGTGKWKLVANIPYYLSAPLLGKMCAEGRGSLKMMVLMLQEEVARRLAALPSTKSYGALTLLVRYFFSAEILFPVPRSAFVPPPRVDSAVIRLEALPPRDGVPETLMFNLIRASFGQRRKTLRNALRALPGPVDEKLVLSALEECGISPGRRGETLCLEDFISLARHLTLIGVK